MFVSLSLRLSKSSTLFSAYSLQRFPKLCRAYPRTFIHSLTPISAAQKNRQLHIQVDPDSGNYKRDVS